MIADHESDLSDDGPWWAGVATYYNNKKIDEGVDAMIDLWNYKVDGGRNVYFKCPICGHEWEETETYGEIEH